MALSQELNRLTELGLQPNQIAVQRTADQIELVWTGPETEGAHSRDTGVVVRELFAQARISVLVSGFAVFQGKQVFKTLADQMDSKPGLSVRNVSQRRPGAYG